MSNKASWRILVVSDRRGDFLHALRRLRRHPGYALSVIVNLTLGIGSVTAIFAVLQGVVLRPLPYPNPDRLVVIQHEMPGIEMAGEPTLFGGFQGQALHYAERSRQLEAIGVFGVYDAALVDGSATDYVRAAYGSTGFFHALGVRPEAGRLFHDDESSGDDSRAVLLTSSAWKGRYGRDPGVVDRLLTLGGSASRIVGVLAEQGPFPAVPVAFWTPRTESEIRQTPQVLVTGLLARMKPGVTTEGLARELDQLIAELPDYAPDDFVRRAVGEGRLRTRVTPLDEYIVGTVAGSLWLLLAAAGLVLIAALANITNLQLLRREAQVRELAVRRALGARWGDLFRLHSSEALVLALMGGAAALVLAAAVVGWVLRGATQDLPRAAEVSLGPSSLVLTLVLVVTSALWLTAVKAVARPMGGLALRSAGSSSGTRSRARLRGTMVVAELAAAAVLLVGAGLVLRSFSALARVDPGFVADSVLTFRVPFPFQEIQDAGGRGRATPLFDELFERFAAIPGVESVGYAKCTPFSSACGIQGLTLQRTDRGVSAAASEELFGILPIGPGFLETLSVPLHAGRHIERRDHEDGTNAVVVSASVAERLWAGEDPIGRQLVTADIPDWSPFTVVGVVGAVHHDTLRGDPEAMVYIPVLTREQALEMWTASFTLQTAVPPLELVDEVRAVLRELRPDIPLAHIETLSGAVDRSTARLRFVTALLAAAALATLALSATGVYGVIAYAVTLRRGEFGIRLALGADAPALRRLVLLEGAVMTVAGLGLGVVGALAGGRLLESVLFGVAPLDPPTYLLVAALLAGAALVASYVPARWVARVDPAEVLRAD